MTWPNACGPRPPSRRQLEKQLGAHLQAMLAPPSSLDPVSRPPFDHWLDAHRDWRLAPLQALGGDGPVSDEPRAEADTAGPVGTGSGAHLGLLLVLAITLLGDVSTLYVSVSVLGNAAAGVSAGIALSLGVLAMFLAHQVGRWLGRRGEARLPGILVLGAGGVWVSVGVLAALMRLAAPVASVGGFGGPAANAAAVSVLLAALLFVLYAGNGLAAATYGFRTASGSGVDLGARLSAARARRQRTAQARIDAHTAVLKADTDLRLAEHFGLPMSTDLRNSFREEVPR